jgi:hypothetical protein
MAEGAPAESQIVLGWRVNTREMTIGLPGNKFADWTGDIQKLIDKRRGTFGEVESLAGRLGHASYAIPLTRHCPRENRTNRLSSRRSQSSDPRTFGRRRQGPRTLEDLSDQGKSGSVNKLSHYSKADANLLVGRVPLWHWWIQPGYGESVESKDPQ